MPGTVFLIGFMGAGKTTLAKKLAAKLGVQAVDLDSEICKRHTALSIAELIEQKGMDFFRQAESDTLKTLAVADAVVATGGGAPCYFDNLNWMLQNGRVVYIDLDEATLFNRLVQTDLKARPLLKDLNEDGLRQFIHEKLQERLPFYSQAHIRYNPLRQDISELLTQL